MMNKAIIVLSIILMVLLLINNNIPRKNKEPVKISALNQKIYLAELKLNDMKLLTNKEKVLLSLERIQERYITTKQLNKRWVKKLSHYYKYYPELKIFVEELKNKNN